LQLSARSSAAGTFQARSFSSRLFHQARSGLEFLELQRLRRPSLDAFVHEFRYTFPIGVDAHRDGQAVPETMQAYNLRGTPSLILIDKRGMVREILFGQVDELALGVAIGKLMAE
jgi:hypothetical protein